VATATHCPNCGANVRGADSNDSVRCRFCGTHVTFPRTRSRRELEAERDEIVARENASAEELRLANARNVEDYVVPPVGCCGIYFALFVVGSLILSAIGLKESKPHSTAVAAIAIALALAGLVLIIWRREARRRERVVALERERIADGELRRERLREIEAELEDLSD